MAIAARPLLLVLACAAAVAVLAVDPARLGRGLNAFGGDSGADDMCTTLAVSPGASSDKSVMTTHTNDCAQCDFRVARVPAKHHDLSKDPHRPVYAFRLEYPRYVGYARGPDYHPENVDMEHHPWTETPAIGHIPQVEHTYAYYDAIYGVMNEKQLAFGESTCSGPFASKPAHEGGHALFDVAELTRVAMERTSTARDAIRLMGSLAEEYGYYQCDWTSDNHTMAMVGGEALSVADTTEAWVFHIIADDTGKSAVWVAQRVPDGEVAVVANDFIIKEVDLEGRPGEFMASSNYKEVAIRNGLFKPKSDDELLNWQRTYTVTRAHPEYVSRRVWRVFNIIAPSLNLDPRASMYDLPFSVRPEKLLSVQDVMNIQRDHYEGTEFDLTQGIQSGPFGNPNRYDSGTGGGLQMAQLTPGHFERAISIMRTSHTSVTQSRHWLPDTVGGVLWMAQYAPAVSVFVPLWPAQLHAADCLTRGSLYALDRDVMWWAFAAVGNYAERSYRYIVEDIHLRQQQWEAKIWKQQALIEDQALLMLFQHSDEHGVKRASKYLTDYSNGLAKDLTKDWWKLFDYVLTRHHDGYRLDDFHQELFRPTKLFYPMWWLQRVGYFPAGYVAPDNTPALGAPVTPVATPVVGGAPTAGISTTLPPTPTVTPAPASAVGPATTAKPPTLSAALLVSPMFPEAAPADVATVSLAAAVPHGTPGAASLPRSSRWHWSWSLGSALALGALVGFAAGRARSPASLGSSRAEYELIQ